MLTEVYSRDSYAVANAKDDIKNGDASNFSNMPRNIYHNRNDTGPLKQKHHRYASSPSSFLKKLYKA